MKDQFFGKLFYGTFFGIVGLFLFALLLSLFGFTSSFLVLAGFLVLIGSIYKPEIGLALVFVEVMSNAHGHLIESVFFGTVVSLRMVLFLSVMLGWGIHLLYTRKKPVITQTAFFLFSLLFFAVLTGFGIGLKERSVSEVFSDGNAYLFFAYLLPIFTTSWTGLKKNAVLQIFMGGAFFNAISTLILSFLFTHMSGKFLSPIYTFLRDARFAEITRFENGNYRIFLQTQFFVALALMMGIALVFRAESKKDQRTLFFMNILFFLVFVISASRSFYLGIGVGLGVLVALTSGEYLHRKKQQFFARCGLVVAAGVSAYILSFVIILFPFPTPTVSLNATDSTASSRITGTDPATTSRWNLLGPMRNKIQDAPLLGSGFGASVQYVSNDPRIRAETPDGIITTESMEWGWLELWIKMGILGPIGYLLLCLGMIILAFSEKAEPHNWISKSIVGSVVFILVTQVFSPYLNHPIGITAILVLFLFLPSIPWNLFSTALVWQKQKTPLAVGALSFMSPVKTKSLPAKNLDAHEHTP